MKNMKVIVLGSQSYLNNTAKGGIQFIAEGLAARGFSVDYISTSSSPLDLFSSSRRARFTETWLRRRDKSGMRINENLTEYVLKAPFPTRKQLLRFDWQIKAYPMLASKSVIGKTYDICINDASNTFLFLPAIKARRYFFRLSDLPSGFSFVNHERLAEKLDSYVSDGKFDEIWAVSKPLVDYALKLNPSGKVVLIPNGVDLTATDDSQKRAERKPKTAVYIGSIERWIDIELVDRTAKLLPDWKFDFFGPLSIDFKTTSSNVNYNGSIKRTDVLKTLTGYDVGLIPFKDASDRIHTVERPLKFYEYIAAGLGVAATDVGAMKQSMGEWASFGRTPEEFAAAVVKSAESAKKRPPEAVKQFIAENSWENIVNRIVERINRTDFAENARKEF